ncbi:D-alanyl-D-alanine carboxypeptidase [Candidatus Peregrinibacteria bacterium]|nr:D-alanyl-D-alanine carboxypeptidase [Candidatus Peregrinibacteria bacterium]
MLTTLVSLIAAQNLINGDITSPSSTVLANVPQPTEVFAYAEKTGNSFSPIIGAKAAISIDLDSNRLLFEQNSNTEMPMASLTKMMTILLTLENHSLDDIVTVDARATKVEPGKINLRADEEITVRELIKAALIKSANDAALALALYDVDNGNKGDVQLFVDKMNARAQELGMNNTRFENPIGFDSEDPENQPHYSTASDLTILARALYKYPFIQDIATIKSTTVNSLEGDTHQVDTTNELLNSYLNVLGLKTGTTDLAGECLISIVKTPTGNKILNVILNSPSRYKESKILSQWVINNFTWI